MNITTLEWTKQTDYGNEISVMIFSTMVYYKSCLFLVNGLGPLYYELKLYRYCFDIREWHIVSELSGKGRGFVSGIIYNEYFYIFSGGNGKSSGDFSEYIVRVNLDDDNYRFEEMTLVDKISIIYFGLTINDDLGYIFGGYSEKNNVFTNELFSVNLQNGLFSLISKRFETPEKDCKHRCLL